MTEEEDMVRLIGYGRTDLSSDTHTSRSAAVLLPLVVADCGHVEGGQWGGTEEGHEAWAVSVQSVAVRLATPLGHIKKKKCSYKSLQNVTVPYKALQNRRVF